MNNNRGYKLNLSPEQREAHRQRMLGNNFGALTVQHGLAHKKGIYYTWKALRTRITYDKYHGFEHYGGKGLLFDPSWTSFECFQRDMQETWYEGAVLHRVDRTLGYFKDNCVWVAKGVHASLHNLLRAERKRNGETPTY